METTDPTRLAQTGAWLRRASQDMRAAAHDMKAEPPLFADIVFHCQQAVEKSLCGFLVWHEVEFRDTHDLAEIGTQCVEIDSSLAAIVTQAAALTGYERTYRYPVESDEPEEPSSDEVQAAMNVTHAVASAIIDRLPEEIHQS